MLAQISSYWHGLSKAQRFAAGVASGIVLSMLSGWLATTLEAELGVRAPSMSFLISVLLAAIWFGRRVAFITAIFAALAYNFYLVEPRYTFGFAGFEDVFTLLVFVSVAVLIGGMAGNLHDQRERAREQVRILSGLFTVSRSMAECTSEREALEQLAAGAREVVARDAIVYGKDHQIVGAASAAPALSSLNEAQWHREDVSAEGESVGTLVWRRTDSAPGAEQTLAVRLILELARVAIERTHILQRRVEMDTLAATERLRTALLSSISHDFRTPISTILTSATSLREFGDQFPPATSTDLLVTIEEEAERLNRFVGNVLNMTRLEANVVKPRVEWIDPLEIIEAVQHRLSKRVVAENFVVTAPAAVPSIFVDSVLLEQALLNVIENALVHAPGGKLRIGADYGGDTVRIWVEDEGPGVPQPDLVRIFDKFHRLGHSSNTQGVGLGLAITKGFVEAMKGEVSAASPVKDGRGLRVEFVFPMQTELVTA